MSFIEKLQTSKTLKIKFKGKMYPVPPPIFRQARKFALEAVGIDYDVFKKNPTSQKDKDRQVKEAFEQFLESYFEAIVPHTKSNPSAKKIEAAFRVMNKLVDSDQEGGLIKEWFSNRSAVEQKQLSSALKGAIMVITHIYTEGAAKIPKENFGYKEDQSKEGQQQVQIHRLIRATVGFLTMSLISKLYTLNPKELEAVLLSEVPRDELESFWKDPKKSDLFFRKLKDSANRVLSKIDILDATKV
jgi:hypothetical protein